VSRVLENSACDIRLCHHCQASYRTFPTRKTAPRSLNCRASANTDGTTALHHSLDQAPSRPRAASATRATCASCSGVLMPKADRARQIRGGLCSRATALRPPAPRPLRAPVICRYRDIIEGSPMRFRSRPPRQQPRASVVGGVARRMKVIPALMAGSKLGILLGGRSTPSNPSTPAIWHRQGTAQPIAVDGV